MDRDKWRKHAVFFRGRGSGSKTEKHRRCRNWNSRSRAEDLNFGERNYEEQETNLKKCVE